MICFFSAFGVALVIIVASTTKKKILKLVADEN